MPANRRYLTLTTVSLLFATACIGGAVTMRITGTRIWDIPVFAPSESAQPLTNQLSSEKVQGIARSITVKVLSNKTSGSGILVSQKGANGKKEDIYRVLTNRHVLVPGEPYRIQTPDGKIYQANVVKDVNFKGSDLALLQFSSAQDYTLAELMSVSTLAVNQQVFAAGFVSDAEKLVFTTGEVSLLPDKAFQDGYQIGYTNNVQKGMSGGPILNRRGEVIGINGILANPIWGDPYVFKDGSKPNSSEREKMSRYSWGIAIKTAVELSPEFVETNQVKELDRIAEEITVRIDFPNGNGSGAIIAKQNGLFTNNYYILTAYHVVDEAVKYQVVTPDGRRHSVDYSTVKRLPGVDLAVLQFTSNQSYRVASLASKSLFNKDHYWNFVCVSGWPISKTTGDQPSRLFSVGAIIEPNLIEFVRKNSGSLTDGYEMAYSNITTGGVSGGPVLDIKGQVIGIHGRADGEETINQAGQQRRIQLGYSFGIPISKFLGITSQIGLKFGEFKIGYPVLLDLSLDRNNVRSKEKRMRDLLNILVALLTTNPYYSKDLDTSKDPIELTNYANSLWRIGLNAEALEVLNRAVKIQPELYQAWYLRGLVLSLNKQKSKEINQEALASFAVVTIIEPKFSAAWRWQGMFLQELEQYEEALLSINKAIEIDFNDSRLYNVKAHVLGEQKRYKEAIAAYTRSIEIQPNWYAYFNRGVLKNNYMKDRQRALDDYTKAIELKPDLFQAYAYRGGERYALGDAKGALDDYAKAIELKPDYAEGYVRRGMVQFLLKNKKEALADYAKAIKLKPDYAEAYFALGNYYFDSENLQAAIINLTKAINLNRNLFAAYSLRASAYYKRNDIKLNDIQNARTDFTQAIQINPDHLEAYQGRGELYYNIGEYQNAILDFSQVIRLKSNDLQAYNNRGLSYLKINNLQNARSDFERVIQLNPNLAEAYLSSGITRFKLNDYSGAVNDLTQAIERPSSDNICTACAYKIRGIAQSQLGNRQGAVADLEKAAQLFREQGDMAK
ncbi:tetratricopeptide repeat protein [Microcoleus anatoxicus]|uniref:Tetratricopeptide repeat protein n=1 Tax=Microcoleus anatoxicus PTRS2 TaxID=2705321 RepID=A0ABU8YUQ9_9CYAN